MKVIVLIPAAGLGTRMGNSGGKPTGLPRKPFLLLDGVPILIHTLRKFLALPEIHAVYVALRPEDMPAFLPYLEAEAFHRRVELVEGGDNRQESVENCLRRVPSDTDLVAVHDAVRPFVEIDAIRRVLEVASRTGAAILGIPAVDTIKQVERVGGGDYAVIRATLKREVLVQAQTPQVFRYDVLRRAYEHAGREGFVGTDEASLVEHMGAEVHVVMGSDRNIKITKPGDLEFAHLIREGEKARSAATIDERR
jgi:2-C-methyl-D-erythritol 4-phosphate cytidylyltransferase